MYVVSKAWANNLLQGEGQIFSTLLIRLCDLDPLVFILRFNMGSKFFTVTYLIFQTIALQWEELGLNAFKISNLRLIYFSLTWKKLSFLILNICIYCFYHKVNLKSRNIVLIFHFHWIPPGFQWFTSLVRACFFSLLIYVSILFLFDIFESVLSLKFYEFKIYWFMTSSTRFTD